MKKLYPLLTGLLLVSMIATAQTDVTTTKTKTTHTVTPTGNFSLAATYGWAIPEGNFGSHDILDVAKGYATTGYNFTLHGGIVVAKNLSIEADYFFSRFGIHENALSNSGYFLDYWKYSGFTIGPSLGIPLSKRLSAHVKIAAGTARVRSAVPNKDGILLDEVRASTFAFKPGFDLKYHISNRIFILGNLDYIYMSPKFKYSGGNDLDQNIAALHVGFGLGFTF
jgi:hypothetical protein